MNRSRDDLVPQVVSYFRRGFDTKTISDVLEIKEAAIERVLHVGLDSNRRAAIEMMGERANEKDQDQS
jgi:hypothetical protein